jgi:hypothetical protein
LSNLAKKGVIIFDIFPFPVFQSTDIRNKINRQTKGNFPQDKLNEQPAFEEYLNEYFTRRLKILIEQIKNPRKQDNLKIKYYLFAPKLTSIQFLYWASKNSEIKNNLVKFDKKTINKNVEEWLNDSLKAFIGNIANNDEVEKQILIDLIGKYPIFMNGSGQPSFNNFINGKKSE